MTVHKIQIQIAQQGTFDHNNKGHPAKNLSKKPGHSISNKQLQQEDHIHLPQERINNKSKIISDLLSQIGMGILQCILPMLALQINGGLFQGMT